MDGMALEFKPALPKLLLAWYDQYQRQLPWRETTDPYPIWIAEIMLQQTRVETVLPYYQRWLERFPTIQALAAASQEQVLNLWEGLGYYSRARNLHKAARIVVDQFDGSIPSDLHDLERLPGIGKAGAHDILSIAFGQDYACVDGNIRRVISRIFEVESVQGSAEFETRVQTIVTKHLPSGRAGDYNQAWMDLGASICLPTEPKCDLCPVKSECRSFAHNSQLAYPLKKTKLPVPVLISVAVVFLRTYPDAQQVLLYQRSQTGLLAGMWSFPSLNVDSDKGVDPGYSELAKVLV